MSLPRQPKLRQPRERTAGGPVEGDDAISQLFGWESPKAMQEHLRQVRRRFENERAKLLPEAAPDYVDTYAANDPEHGYDLPTKHGGPAGPGNPHYFPNEAAAWRFYDRAISSFRERVTNDEYPLQIACGDEELPRVDGKERVSRPGLDRFDLELADRGRRHAGN
jgi:hypothetical protein